MMTYTAELSNIGDDRKCALKEEMINIDEVYSALFSNKNMTQYHRHQLFETSYHDKYIVFIATIKAVNDGGVIYATGSFQGEIELVLAADEKLKLNSLKLGDTHRFAARMIEYYEDREMDSQLSYIMLDGRLIK
jgi:hypothetical protein